MDIPYLKVPYFIDGRELRVSGSTRAVGSDTELEIFSRIYSGGATLEELAADVAGSSEDPSLEAATARLRARFSDPESAIGLVSIDAKPSYDVVVVDQGYGGVYVHTIELLKRLAKRWSCLLICPEIPLFEDTPGTDVITLKGLRASIPDLSYFSFVHIVRTLVSRTKCTLLLLTHRSQSLFLFDLVGSHRTVIYCDGFHDGGFANAQQFRMTDTPERRHEALSEVYYMLANGDPNFFGMAAGPSINIQVLIAGCIALRGAKENWCWGAEQTSHFRSAFPEIADQIKFMPPFTDPDLFHPEWVDRERIVLFTTTMHNIKKKGLPELLRAMQRLRSLRVRCVVRQPQHLPEIPASCRRRMEIGPVPKHDMVRLYHKVWLNCRTSREESSPVSILESMICEVPQVTSTVVAAQIPILENGVTGFVLHPDDGAGIARGLKTLMNDPELRDAMGKECRRRALAYSFEARASAFEDLLVSPSSRLA